jgi:hypothetical protein
MKKVTPAGRVGIVAAVLAALLIPAAAVAGPGQGDAHTRAASRPAKPTAAAARPTAGTPVTAPAANGQPAENLAKRITNVLAARKRRFDAASNAIAAHISRVSALADKVETAGGDVSKVRGYLTEATDALAAARALEQEATTRLKAVPGSSSPKADLAAGRASGVKAVAQLKIARKKVVLAVHELRAAVKAMEPPSEASESP